MFKGHITGYAHMSIRWAACAERVRDRSIEILGIIYGATKLWPWAAAWAETSNKPRRG